MNTKNTRPKNLEIKHGYIEAFSWLQTPAVPNGLIQVTLQRIARRARRVQLAHLSAWLVVWAGSVAATVYTASLAIQDLYSSGIMYYLSLAWTDSQTVLNTLSEQFAILIVDTLPIFSLTLTMAAFALLLWSFKKSVSFLGDSRLAV